VVARDAVTAADVRARMAAQIDPAAAAARADFIIENDADLATLELRARKVYDALLEAPTR
jgi:dephospho-CoA kinase